MKLPALYYYAVGENDDLHAWLSDVLSDKGIGKAGIHRYRSLADLEENGLSDAANSVVIYFHNISETGALEQLGTTNSHICQSTKLLIASPSAIEKAAASLEYGIHDYLTTDDLSKQKLTKAICHARERVKLKSDLSNSNQRFEAIFKNASNPILLADDNGRYIDANAAAGEMLGYGIGELKKIGVSQVISTSSESEGRSRWAKFLEQEKDNGKIRLRRKDGTHLTVNYKAVSNILPGVHLSILEDITGDELDWQKQALLSGIYRISAQNLGLSESLTLALKSICEHIGYECAELWWTDERQENLFPEGGFYGAHDAPLHHLGKNISDRLFKLSSAPNVRKALKTGKVISLPDLKREPSFHRGDLLPDDPSYSALIIPVIQEDDHRGVLLFLKNGSPEDDELLLRLLKSVATPFVDEMEKIRMRTELGQVIRKSPDPIAILDLKRKFTRVNPAFEETLGYSGEELKEMSFAEIIHPEHNKKAMQLLQKTLKGKELQMEEILTIAKSGQQRLIEFSAVPNKGSGTIYLMGRDITEHTKAKEKLIAVNRKFELATKTAELGIWEWHKEDDSVILDGDLSKIYGLQKSESRLSLREWLRFIHPDEKHWAERKLRACMESGERVDIQHRLTNAMGEKKHLKTTAEAVRDASGNIISIVGLSLDVTRYVESEHQKGRALYNLRERIKEQECLYNISKIYHQGISVENLLTEAVQLLPSGWQHPSIAEACIEFDGCRYTTANYQESYFSLSTARNNSTSAQLKIDIIYREEPPNHSNEVFLKEERALIEAVAEHLLTAIDRILNKQKLEEREARFRNLIENNHDAILIQDENLKLTYASPSVEKMTGYRPEEIIGSHGLDHIHPEDLERHGPMMKDFFESEGKVVRIKERIRRKDGRYIWIYATLSDQRKVPGIDGVVYNFKDIDAEERAHQELELSESRLAKAQRIAKMGYWRLDLETMEHYWSKEMFHLIGFDPKDGKADFNRFFEMIHPEDKHLFDFQQFMIPFESGDNRLLGEVEYRYIKADGSTMWISGQINVLKAEGGKVKVLEGIIQDNTDRKIADLLLEEREEQFRLFLKNSPALSWLKDKDGKLVAANEKFMAATGRSAQDIGKDPEEYREKETAPETRENDLKVFEECKPLKFTEVVPMPDGELRTYEVHKFPIRSRNKLLIGGFALDITERNTYLKAIKKQNKKLREIAWMQSHVVRAPVARLMGLIALLKDYSLSENEKADLLNKIQESAGQLDEVIREIIKTSSEVKAMQNA